MPREDLLAAGQHQSHLLLSQIVCMCSLSACLYSEDRPTRRHIPILFSDQSAYSCTDGVVLAKKERHVPPHIDAQFSGKENVDSDMERPPSD